MPDESPHLPAPQAASVAELCPDGVDLSAEYVLWLDEACPVHSFVVAGVDIPKYIQLVPQVCPSCGHRETPAADIHTGAQAEITCPKCAANGKRVKMRPERQAAPMRAHKRLKLSDAQLRAIWAKLDPRRPVRHDEQRGHKLDGPRMIPAKGGRGEVPAFAFVRIQRVEQAQSARLQTEPPAKAAQRVQALRRLAYLADYLTTPGLRTTTREAFAKEITQLRTQLGILPGPEEAADPEPEVALNDDNLEASGEVSDDDAVFAADVDEDDDGDESSTEEAA